MRKTRLRQQPRIWTISNITAAPNSSLSCRSVEVLRIGSGLLNFYFLIHAKILVLPYRRRV